MAIVGLALALVYALPFFSIEGTAQIFLKITNIKGGSADPTHRDWIDSLSVQYGVTRPIQLGGGTRSIGKVNLSELTVSKPLDISSPALFREATIGKGQDVNLELVRSLPDAQRYYRIHLYDALVSAFSSSSGGDAPMETVSFNYTKIEVTFTDFQPNSTQDSTAWYDLATAKGGFSTGPINATPTMSALPNTNTLEDAALTLAFTIGDNETPPDSLVLSASSDNPVLVPTNRIIFGGAGTERTVTISPATNQAGTVNLTFAVSDGVATTFRSFTLTVAAVNDPPQISNIPGQSTMINTPVSVNFTIGDVDSPLSNLVLQASSDNLSLVPNANLVFGDSGANRNLTITPTTGQSGQANITISVSDGLDTSTNSFLLVVNQTTPSAPTAILLSANAVPENSTNGTVIGLLSAVDPDSATHTFALLDSAGGRFAIQGSQLVVNNSALLDYEAAPSHSILVRATDPDAQSFTTNLNVVVVNVNEAPSFIVTDASVIQTLAGKDTPITRLQVQDPDSGTNPLTLSLDVVNGVLTIATNPPGSTITSNGTAHVAIGAPADVLNAILSSSQGIIYRTPAGSAGSDQLTATLNDNGFSGLGGTNAVYTTLGIRFYRDLYDQWLHENFTEAELEDVALEQTLWGPHADSDGDSLENLAEYGMGLPPRTAGAPLTANFISQGAQQYLTLTLNRRRDPNLTLEVQVAGTLSTPNWSSDPANLETSPPQDLGNGFDQITFRDLTPSSTANSRFMRVRWRLTIP